VSAGPFIRSHVFAPALLLILAAPFAYAQAPLTFGWGASLQTIGTIANAGVGPAIDSQDAFSLGLELASGAGQGLLSLRVSGQALYTPQQIVSNAPPLSALTGYPTVSAIIFELPPPRLVGWWIRASAGRLVLDEPTGLLLDNPNAIFPNQLADGLLFEARFQGFYGSVGAGYLGLLEKSLNRVRFTPQDEAELADSSVYFAPPRGMAVLRLEADNLFLGQKLGLFGIGQKDFRSGFSTFDSWYVGLLATGPVASAFRQESAFMAALAVPSDGSAGVGLLIREQLAWRVPVSFLHEAWFSMLWASSPGGALVGFPALAGPPVADTFAAPLTDIVRLELGIDAALPAAPAGAVLTPAFTTRLLLRPSGAQAPGYTFSLAGQYVGTELELSAGLSPLDGVRVLARGGTLIASGVVLPYVRLEAGLSL